MQADHLVQQQLGRQRVAPKQKWMQDLLDDVYLRCLDRSEQAGDTRVGQDIDVGGSYMLWCTGERFVGPGLVELAVQVERQRLAVAGREGWPGPGTTHLKEAHICDLHFTSLCGDTP